MSWLRRVLGGNGGDGDRSPGRRPRAVIGNGPVYGHGEVEMEQAKSHLLELLRERGAAGAVIAYDGGNDEGWITQLGVDSTAVDVDTAYDDFESPDGLLLQAAEAVVADKWGSFAGHFEVRGRLVVDVAAERVERHDSVSVEDGPFENEDEVV